MKTNTRRRFIEFDDRGGDWSGNGYTIRALPTQLGYLITDEAGTRLGYTGDTVCCPAVEELARASSALVMDTSFHHSKAGHMGLDDVEAGIQLSMSHPSDSALTGFNRPRSRPASDP
ncbi:MBL fold metallo-hydrolase [Streptosporangium soli]|nr:hypothetical protein [Streptosporangium sp. KLBMP 9127]